MRNQRAILFLVLSAVCGLLTAYGVNMWVKSAERARAASPIATAPVVIAARDLAAGAAIEARLVDVSEWPVDYLPRGVFADAESVADRIPHHTISAGEPIFENSLLPEGSGAGLSAMIDDKHRAMSVEVDAVVGVAGFVRPGSRVDVLATLRDIPEKGRPRPYARTILQNVRVLAIDQQLGSVSEAEPRIASVVTLQVNPEEAQILAFGAANGDLKLSLRNPIDSDFQILPSTTPTDLMDVIEKLTVGRHEVSTAQPRAAIQEIRGSDLSNKFL
jgi:pilus assembly protein CpaB